jgi:hypothetical protein
LNVIPADAEKDMFIQTEATPNPATLKFLPGKVMPKKRRPVRRSPPGCS